jgi:hypothetical protein
MKRASHAYMCTIDYLYSSHLLDRSSLLLTMPNTLLPYLRVFGRRYEGSQQCQVSSGMTPRHDT